MRTGLIAIDLPRRQRMRFVSAVASEASAAASENDETVGLLARKPIALTGVRRQHLDVIRKAFAAP
jgi:hypothetical protein